jgi:hypothetical protein
MPDHTKSERRKTSKKVSRKIKKLRAEGKPQRRAVAQAINTVTPSKVKKLRKRK